MVVFKSQIWNQFFKHFILLKKKLFQTFGPQSPFTKLVVDLKGIDPDDAFSGNLYFQHPYKTWIYYFCFKWFLKTKIFIVNYFWLKIGDWILLHIWTCQNKNIRDLSWHTIDNHVEIHDAVIPYEKGATFLWYLEELVKTFYLLK